MTDTAARAIIFLHIPKTAGQSVHAFLKAGIPAAEICPARENWQLTGTSIAELRRYRLFSGHLDWVQLDCVGGNPFIFTILREPVERILSFYFFLRREAQGLTPEQLASPERRGMRAVMELTPDQYFCGGGPEIRNFLDDHFDNFYVHYFAGRSFDARRRLRSRLGQPPRHMTEADLVDLARSNLAQLSGVYRVDQLDRLEADLRPILPGAPRRSLSEIRVNVGQDEAASRMVALGKLGPAEKARARIDEMCRLDRLLWNDPATFAPR